MKSLSTITFLVQKDIRMQRKTALFLIFFVFMLLMSLSSNTGTTKAFASPYITASVGAAIFWTLSVCSYEGFYKLERLFASLPILRSEMVYARYASSMLAVINAVLLSAIFGGLLKVLHIKPDAQTMTAVDAAAAFVSSSILVFGYLPVYFKLGYLRSRLYNILVFAALGAVIVLVSLLIDALGIHLAAPAAVIMVAIVLYLSLCFISIRLSVRFFQKREL